MSTAEQALQDASSLLLAEHEQPPVLPEPQLTVAEPPAPPTELPPMENLGYDQGAAPLMANMGYDEQLAPAVTPGNAGPHTPWHEDDHEFPASVGPVSA